MLARRTRFVEIGPVVLRRALARSKYLPARRVERDGLGLRERLDAPLESFGLTLGIVDAVPVDHSLRPPVENYSRAEAEASARAYLAANRHRPVDECMTCSRSSSLDGSSSPRSSRPRDDVSILIVARDDPKPLWAQIESLVEAGLSEATEVVVVDDASGPEIAALLGRLEGDVVVRRRPGRSAAAPPSGSPRRPRPRTSASPSRPKPGRRTSFAEALLAAVRGGAPLAVPVLETAGGLVAGYRVAEDGSLWPLSPDARRGPRRPRSTASPRPAPSSLELRRSAPSTATTKPAVAAGRAGSSSCPRRASRRVAVGPSRERDRLHPEPHRRGARLRRGPRRRGRAGRRRRGDRRRQREQRRHRRPRPRAR